MIVVNDVHQWHQMKAGVAVAFDNENPRAATLDFNAAGTANIYIVLNNDEKKQPRLLARIEGRQTVKFAVPCGYRIVNKTEDVDVWIFSRDSSKVHRVAVGEEVYTTLHEPSTRDPELERILEKMNRATERRVQAMKAQMEREYAARAERDTVASNEQQAAPVVQPVAEPVVTAPAPVEPVTSGSE